MKCGNRKARERTFATVGKIFATFTRMVARAHHIPHVVHRPDNFLALPSKPFYILERNESLINPIQANDIGLFNPSVPIYANSHVGNIDLEEVFAVEPVIDKDF